MWKNLYSLVKKDCRMMVSGKFLLVAFGSFLIYTLFINFGYLNLMEAEIYNVYLYDPSGTQTDVSPLVHSVSSPEELIKAIAKDTSGVGIDACDGEPNVILYEATEKADQHRVDYALSLLHSDGEYMPEIVGNNTPEMKQRKEITCELLFIEIVAVGFLGIASVLFKEKQMGVICVHVIIPLNKNLFGFSKVFLFLLTDLVFAVLMTLFNIGISETKSILPAVLIQTAILSLIVAFVGFGCAMLLKDFKQFSLVYLVTALFVVTPIFLAANTSVKVTWLAVHPFYHVYMGLKNAFFGMPVTNPVYYICVVCTVIVFFGMVNLVFRKEMGREG